MPYVESEAVIKATPRAVYEVCKRTAEYPQFMSAVEKIVIEVDEPGRQVSYWESRVKGALLKWREQDTHDDENMRIHYDQLDGDLKIFRGDWIITEHPEGAVLKVTCEFEIGIPMFAAMLNPVAKLVVRDNLSSMIKGVKGLLEAAS